MKYLHSKAFEQMADLHLRITEHCEALVKCGLCSTVCMEVSSACSLSLYVQTIRELFFR